nr:MAG TPA: hypothetical protein [Caudoviricetes sp.]
MLVRFYHWNFSPFFLYLYYSIELFELSSGKVKNF